MIRLFDAHADTPYELWRKQESLRRNSCHIDLEKAAVFSSYAQIFAFCSLSGTKWELSSTDFENCHRSFSAEIASQNIIQPYFSIEGPEIIDCNAENLSRFQISMSTLTWNADNVLAGSHTSDKGLTECGLSYVRLAQAQGVIIDVSHLSDNAFWDLVRMTEKPICASHSNCRSLCNHSRNLTDDQLRAIAQTDGIIGLNLYAEFLGNEANFETLRRHLEHMLHLCGDTHVGLGGDLDGCDMLPKGFGSVASYLDFYQYLQDCGYDEALLDQIFYSNLARLF